MGTHPIFESDFDCLTECCESLREPWQPQRPDEWTQSRLSSSARFKSMLLVLHLKALLTPERDMPKKLLISKNALPVLAVVVTWINFPKSAFLHQILPRMQLMESEQLISKSMHNFPNELTVNIYCRSY